MFLLFSSSKPLVAALSSPTVAMKDISSTIVSLALAAASVQLAYASGDSTYAISDGIVNQTSSPNEVATPFYMPPNNCTCKKSGSINDEQCDQFDCSCLCDLTAGVCDINCCCDPECHDSDAFNHCSEQGGPSPMMSWIAGRSKSAISTEAW